MAKKRLKIKDKQGNIVNYDISSASVTIDVEGKTLDVKLTELVAAIQAAVNTVVYNGVPHYVNNSMVDLGNQIQPDWAESSTNYPSFIRNKPDVVTGIKVGEGGETITPTGGIITLPNSGGQVTDADTEMSDTSENAVQNKVIKAYVDNLISGLIDGAPQALDTLNELAAALNDNASFASAITQQLAAKQDTLVAGNGIAIGNDGKTVSVAESIRTGAGKGVADVSSPQEDGSFTITLADGDTYTVNLNHQHTQYQPLLTSANAGSNITITTDQQGNIIISATGGGGGGTQVQADWNQTNSTAVDFIKNKPTIPVVPTAVSAFTNDAGYLTQQSLAGRVQSNDVVNIVKITQSAYDALSPKDSSTLYLITES